MNSVTSKLAAGTVALVTLAFGISFSGARAGATPGAGNKGRTATQSAAACKGADLLPVVHADATRREATLTALTARLSKRADRYGLNGPQTAALQSANSAVAALDAHIASTCYPTLAAFKADSSKLFVDYRVYWLRVPQTNVILAADSLAGARQHLGNAATKLGAVVGSNATAKTDLAAMTAALADADARLGVAPTAGPVIAPVATLAPAADMTTATATLQAGRADLVAAASALARARAAGLRVIADLRG